MVDATDTRRSLLSDRIAAARITDVHFHRASYGLLLAVAALTAFTLLDYGVTWDEQVHKIYGDFVMEWYRSLFRDTAALRPVQHANMFIYGGLFEILAHLIGPLLPLGLYEGRHLVTAAFGILGLAIAYRLGAHLGGAKAGFLSALALSLTPVFYGQMFFNFKDIPFASLYLLALYFSFLVYDALPHVPKRLLLACGVAIGLALGVRVAGVLLLGYLGLLGLAWLLIEGFKGETAFSRRTLTLILPVGTAVGIIAALAWLVMLIWWPWAQVSPFANPLRALQLTLYFSDWFGTVFFDGRTFPVAELPRSYLPTWIAISLPEFYFIALAVGAALAAQALVGRQYSRERCLQFVKIGALIIAALLPLATAVIRHSIVFDGMRHFLFVLPPLAVLAGVSVAHFLAVPRFAVPLKAAVALALAFSAAVTVFDLVRLHPYQYVYFNRLVAGGAEAGARRFETDYWGLSYKEGVDWLIDNYRPDTSNPIGVANCSLPLLTGYYLDNAPAAKGRFVSVLPSQRPRIFMATTRFSCQNSRAGRVLHVVERAGVPLLYIKELPP